MKSLQNHSSQTEVQELVPQSYLRTPKCSIHRNLMDFALAEGWLLFPWNFSGNVRLSLMKGAFSQAVTALLGAWFELLSS